MQSRWPASNFSFSALAFLVLCGLSGAISCSDQAQSGPGARDGRADLILDEAGDEGERLRLMDGLKAPCPQEVVEALLQVMKDTSQQAYLLAPDDSDLGYEAIENLYAGPDTRAPLRWTAIMALERLAEVQALPDLLAALNDRHRVVANHAARALWKLGSRAGLPVLIESLKAKAFPNETANRILKEISGQDFGFDTDAGWVNKSKAIEQWQAWADSKPATPRELPKKGQDADLDRRVRFIVQMLGQKQFLFMEQARRELSKMGPLALAHIREAIDAADETSEGQLLRAYIVQALALMQTPEAQALIVERLQKDQAAPVRSRAAEALGHVKEGGEEALMAAVSDPDSSVVIAAIRSLGRRQIKAVDPQIESVFAASSSSPRLKMTAALTLLRNGQAKTEPRQLLMGIMLTGALHERAELAELLRDWHEDLLGWDETAGPEGQEEALAAWKKLILL